MGKIEEAMELERQAEKRANSWSLLGGKEKYEDAADLLAKAANLYKLEKFWKEAGDAMIKSAEYIKKSGDGDDAGSKYTEAAKCYKKCSPELAIKYMRMSIEMMTEKGRFHAAANQQKSLAEIYESDLMDLDNAMDAYILAGEWYAGEEAQSLANSCFLKAATFAAQLEQYEKAITQFESVASTSITNNLTKYSVKDYLLKAGLCQLCRGDPVTAKKALERYAELDPSFGSSREGEFLSQITDAFDKSDVNTFTQYVQDFDRLTKLDSWKTTLLLRIKTHIGEEPSLT